MCRTTVYATPIGDKNYSFILEIYKKNWLYINANYVTKSSYMFWKYYTDLKNPEIVTLKNLSRESAGVYKCTASNDVGEESCTVEVKIHCKCVFALLKRCAHRVTKDFFYKLLLISHQDKQSKNLLCLSTLCNPHLLITVPQHKAKISLFSRECMREKRFQQHTLNLTWKIWEPA